MSCLRRYLDIWFSFVLSRDYYWKHIFSPRSNQQSSIRNQTMKNEKQKKKTHSQGFSLLNNVRKVPSFFLHCLGGLRVYFIGSKFVYFFCTGVEQISWQSDCNGKILIATFPTQFMAFFFILFFFSSCIIYIFYFQ